MLAAIARSASNNRRSWWSPGQAVVRAAASSGGPRPPYTTLAVSQPQQFVTHVELHRPEKLNAMSRAFWREMVELFSELAGNPDCRVVVFSGAGKMFTAGIDLMDMASDVLQPVGEDTARISWNLRKKIAEYQETFSVIERCPKPVVVAVHGACIGGGVDLITACDIRLCTQDAWFQVKEVDVGLAADVGTLQRLPKVIGSRSLVNELALTARKMFADEAASSGLVSRVFADKEAMMAGAMELAGEIAGRSPVGVQGTKVNLLYSRDHSVAEGLDYMASWNMSMLQTEDLMKSAQAALEKKSPKTVAFSKL
ncbi:delta(3,5)-Delta(2,4)-dienoyl-CoA isomerase, mitochondrial [Takifugu rubripes]|uniref:delta(3,5)-Delta(2,4)-dienoyl-CoA isomerase, mitochondrial n=1 Tax=Takifugu rubripes TaxID=31033 RepID=UPI0011451E55|nr:delta(3,5)-Delta(2,4)-dienoyl-CoA isomerase, mitochondrial [Takifugu rubripes]XP_029699856.1 delta(3,5)-Delta(2,4)-dienoyl-CoA isomerase, mitochondrial [Takifugu rubripes]